MKKKLSQGSIEVREVDVADKMILLGELGYNYSQIEEMMDQEEGEVSSGQMIFMGKLIKKFDDYVLSVDVKIKDKQVTSYKEAIKDQVFVNEVVLIATSVLLGDQEEVAEKKPE